MKKNGFTLIELIGIVAIIALIMIVTIPQILSTMNKSNIDKVESFEHDIELAASSYVENNWNSFKGEYLLNKKETKYCLPVDLLIEQGFISETEIDPSTETLFDSKNKFVLLEDISSSETSYRFSYTYIDVTTNTETICSTWEG